MILPLLPIATDGVSRTALTSIRGIPPAQRQAGIRTTGELLQKTELMDHEDYPSDTNETTKKQKSTNKLTLSKNKNKKPPRETSLSLALTRATKISNKRGSARLYYIIPDTSTMPKGADRRNASKQQSPGPSV